MGCYRCTSDRIAAWTCSAPCPWLLQVFVNVGILAAYLIGYPYEAGMDTVPLLGRQVAWW